MPLTAFRFIGMGAPESTTGSGSSLMGMPSMMLNRVAQMDELRRDSDARGVETLRAALASSAWLSPALSSIGGLGDGIQLDPGFMQSRPLRLAPDFNLSLPYASAGVINFYGDTQFWSHGDRIKDMFVFDFFTEETFEF